MKHEFGYVLIAPCGCVRCAEVDDRHCNPKALLREAVRRGYRMERWTNERIRTTSWRCESAECPFPLRRVSAQPWRPTTGTPLLPLDEARDEA